MCKFDRAEYDRRKAEYAKQLAQVAGRASGAGAAAVGIARLIEEATPLDFRNVVKMLYERITVGVAGELRFFPRTWCSGWA